jgi:hypothetical protein
VSVGVILIAANGDDVAVNWWNWRPTVDLLVREGVVTRQEGEQLCTNGVGARLGAAGAVRAADVVQEIVDQMPGDGRLRRNGSVARDASERHDMPVADRWYGAKRTWLATFSEFARTSNGFLVS